jgi:hypothetical protein
MVPGFALCLASMVSAIWAAKSARNAWILLLGLPALLPFGRWLLLTTCAFNGACL